jgi:hypothetical protein
LQEGSFKQLPQFQRIKQEKNYTDHAWLDYDKLIAGTDTGEMLILDNYEIKQQIDNAFSSMSH